VQLISNVVTVRQGCAGDEGPAREAVLWGSCMDGLRAAAAVLEAAVETVAAAADRPAGWQPSIDLFHTCSVAIYALLSALVCVAGSSHQFTILQ
jgi:hypothetical protein